MLLIVERSIGEASAPFTQESKLFYIIFTIKITISGTNILIRSMVNERM